jgi:hypothetical protein
MRYSGWQRIAGFPRGILFGPFSGKLLEFVLGGWSKRTSDDLDELVAAGLAVRERADRWRR